MRAFSLSLSLSLSLSPAHGRQQKGEAKAARERVTFLRRDVHRGEDELKEARQAAVQVQEKLVLIRNRDPDLWGA